MAVHKLISLHDPDLWRSKLVDYDHSFACTWEHCHSMKLTTGLEVQLYCFESGDDRIACPFSERVFEGHVDIVKPYGFCGFTGARSHRQFATHFREFARDSGYVCGYLGVDPLQEHDFGFDMATAQHCGSVHVLDLRLSERELLGNMSPNRRRQLRNWDEAASAITEDRPELTAFFLERYLGFVRDKAAESFYHFTRETLEFLAAQDRVLLVGARDEDGIAAVSVFAHTRTVGEYLFNVPDGKRGRQYTTALIWQGMKRLQSMGVQRFNLGGSYSADGVFEYKRRFGGRTLALRRLKQIYDPATFASLCRRAGHQARASQFFPPYRHSANSPQAN